MHTCKCRHIDAIHVTKDVEVGWNRCGKQALVNKENNRSTNKDMFIRKNTACTLDQTCISTGPSKHIYYLKIAKSASSTMQSIILKYGVRNQLASALFILRHPFPHPDMIHFLRKPTPDTQGFNLITQHSVFNENQIRLILKGDVKLLSVVRHPFDMLKSAFAFYNLVKHFNLTGAPNPLLTFLDAPEKYDIEIGESNKYHGMKIFMVSHTKNFMAVHFGYQSHHIPNHNQEIKEFVEYIGDKFDFVGLTEHLSETLVYMKHTLCWDLKDVLFLKLRKTPDRKTLKNIEEASDDRMLVQKHRAWAPVDYEFYDYFSNKFHSAIARLGKNFQKEVEHYNNVSNTVMSFCSDWCSKFQTWYKKKTFEEHLEKMRSSYITIDTSHWNSPFTVSAEECLFLMVNPDIITHVIDKRNRQFCLDPECENLLMTFVPWRELYSKTSTFKKDKFLTCIGSYQ